jgi:predicted aspartyl protease
MGRVAVQIEIANDGDLAVAEAGHLPADQVRRTMVEGIVDTGAAMLVLPESVARQLGLPRTGSTSVRYADRRTATRDIVGRARVEIQGRASVFDAVVEPGRTSALIGAIVLEALDLLVDCKTQTLQPRDPNTMITEIE